MEREELLRFVEEIFKRSSGMRQAQTVLQQLKEILVEERAEQKVIDLLEQTNGMEQELMGMASDKQWNLTDEQLRIAEERARQRRIREEEMRHRGRC